MVTINTIFDVIDLFYEPWFLVFAIPILGSILSVFVAKFFGSAIRNYFSIATIAISGVISLLLAFGGDWEVNVIEFIPKGIVGGNIVYFQTAINIDPLSTLVAVVASGLGTLIAIFSLEYMKGDEAETRYYALLQLFVGGMVLLVVAGDLIFLYTGWKIVGVCSYFLIAHWYHKPDPQGRLCALSGMKAFLMTLIGDIALLVSFGILFMETNSVNFAVLVSDVTGFATIANQDLQFLVALGILLAAIGKSAQFPLITWLSSPKSVNIDAMQGPTTVSALIHAACMVKAGVYLMGRFFFVFGPSGVEDFLLLVALGAAITVFVAAASAMVAEDIKRVLAYSTVSQLGYMFLGLAVAYLAAAVGEDHIALEGFMGAQFHLMSHAIFKALLFLAAGAIIHSLHHERNILKMGGLKDELPYLHWASLIGLLALVGFPLFNGFFSKETVLASALNLANSGTEYASWGLLLFAMGTTTAFMTAFYSFRFFFLIFYGEKPEGLKVHPPGIIMRGIVIILAGLVIVTGIGGVIWLNSHFDSAFLWDSIGLHYEDTLTILPKDWFGPILITSLVFIGMGLAYLLYYTGKPRTAMPIIKKYMVLNAAYVIAKEGFYLDAFYQGVQDLFLWLNWRLRKLQTGDLNYNVSLIGLIIVALITLMVLF